MTRRSYKNPPVHEVMVDVQFHTESVLSDEALHALRDELGSQFGSASRAYSMQVAGAISAAGAPTFHGQTLYAGWDFGEDNPRWLVRTHRGSLSVHIVRDGDHAPEGEYLGWEAVAERFSAVHGAVKAFYGDMKPRRAGLRYVNRVLAPAGSSLDEWFTIVPPVPLPMRGTHAFSLGQTWQEVEGHEHFGATVRLAKVEIPENLRMKYYGMVLDLEVFNIWIRNAPKYGDLVGWFEEAHEVENELFESCITPDLRRMLDA